MALAGSPALKDRATVIPPLRGSGKAEPFRALPLPLFLPAMPPRCGEEIRKWRRGIHQTVASYVVALISGQFRIVRCSQYPEAAPRTSVTFSWLGTGLILPSLAISWPGTSLILPSHV